MTGPRPLHSLALRPPLALAATLTLALPSTSLAAPAFRTVIAPGDSISLALAADQGRLAGNSGTAAFRRAIIADAHGSLTTLPPLDASTFSSATALARSSAVGISSNRPVLWSNLDTPNPTVTPLTSPGIIGQASAISDDASVILGHTAGIGFRPFVHRQGFNASIPLDPAWSTAQAFALSPLGSLAVGTGTLQGSPRAWFADTFGSPIAPLHPPSTHAGSHALAVGHAIIAGYASSPTLNSPALWLPTDPSAPLLLNPLLSTHTDARVRALTPDASILAGSSGLLGETPTALLWIGPQRTPIAASDFFASHNLHLGPFSPAAITSISRDGLTFVGFGLTPEGSTHAFIATIPTPASLLPAALLPLTSTRRRRP